MSVITDVESWGNNHRPGFLDVFRILLGLFLTYKGLYFITHMNELLQTTAGLSVYFAGLAVGHYVAFAHILGGPLIAVGLFTRIVSVIQMPILLGAVFLVNYPKGFLSVAQHMELWASLVVLVGLVVFMVFGAGRYSIDAKRRKEMMAANP
ncbi:DoxX family protein [Dawidia soli]|uniref:DoxX family protein n=1 Tax=Dawidia soli TaxID=2782352 RepID=A0AAP2DC57_9BACT|nr:DoxX family protein [Dawidia soli]MBT1687945.1 DoxX family protein [Dawidia soli]